MIPKILHLFWGHERMAYLHTLTIDSFRKYNPGWEIRLYIPEQSLNIIRESPTYTGQDYFHRIKDMPDVKIIPVNLFEFDVPEGLNAAQVSDIIAYQMLHRHGGVYCDFDVLWLRPWSDIANCDGIGYKDDFQALVSYSDLVSGWHSVGVLASEKDSDFMWYVTGLQRAARAPYHYESFGSAMLNNHFPHLDRITTRFDRMLAVDYKTFYPYHVWKLGKLFEETDLTPLTEKVLCVHWFNGHPLAKAYINGNNYPPCSMTEILKSEGYI